MPQDVEISDLGLRLQFGDDWTPDDIGNYIKSNRDHLTQMGFKAYATKKDPYGDPAATGEKAAPAAASPKPLRNVTLSGDAPSSDAGLPSFSFGTQQNPPGPFGQASPAPKKKFVKRNSVQNYDAAQQAAASLNALQASAPSGRVPNNAVEPSAPANGQITSSDSPMMDGLGGRALNLLGMPFRFVDDAASRALGIYDPTEGNFLYRAAPALKEFSQELAAPVRGKAASLGDKFVDTAGPALSGVTDFGTGLVSPSMLSAIGAMKLLGAAPALATRLGASGELAANVGRAANFANDIGTAGFAAQMAGGGTQGLIQGIESGDPKAITQGLLSLGLAGVTAKHIGAETANRAGTDALYRNIGDIPVDPRETLAAFRPENGAEITPPEQPAFNTRKAGRAAGDFTDFEEPAARLQRGEPILVRNAADAQEITQRAQAQGILLNRAKSRAGIVLRPVSAVENTSATTGPGEPQAIPQQVVSPDVTTPAQSVPANAALGHEGQTFTPANRAVPFQYAAVEASDLIPSQTESGGDNPAYEASLQPRDRTRAASQAQVTDLANKLNFARVADSPTTADGAPLVGSDMQVESGNGRTQAIRQAYREGLPTSQGYRADLQQNAARYGIDPQQVSGMKEPVLVRVRQGEMSGPERAAFAQEAGASNVLGMSEAESAHNDGAYLRSSGALDLYQGGTLTGSANKPFVEKFLHNLPDAERAGMLQSDGSLSAAGVRRVRNGLLAAAYDDPQTIARLTEETNPEIKNVGAAMEAAAPGFARLKNEIAAGTRYNLDITSEVTDAANMLAHLRESGSEKLSDVQRKAIAARTDGLSPEVDSFLQNNAGGDLFGGSEAGLSPVGKQLLATFDRYRRSGARISDLLNRYIDGANAAGDPHQGGLFEGENKNPTTAETLDTAIKAIDERAGRNAGQSQLFGNESLRADSDTSEGSRNTPATDAGDGRGTANRTADVTGRVAEHPVAADAESAGRAAVADEPRSESSVRDHGKQQERQSAETLPQADKAAAVEEPYQQTLKEYTRRFIEDRHSATNKGDSDIQKGIEATGRRLLNESDQSREVDETGKRTTYRVLGEGVIQIRAADALAPAHVSQLYIDPKFRNSTTLLRLLRMAREGSGEFGIDAGNLSPQMGEMLSRLKRRIPVFGDNEAWALNPSGEKTYVYAHELHRASVEQALNEGKPVPPEVLADYPGMKAQPPSTPQVPPAVSKQTPPKPAPQVEKAASPAEKGLRINSNEADGLASFYGDEHPIGKKFLDLADSLDAAGKDTAAVKLSAEERNQIASDLKRLPKKTRAQGLEALAGRLEKAEPGGVTLQMSLVPGAAEFVRDDLAPFTRGTKEAVADAYTRAVRVLFPTYGVKRAALDSVMEMKGERDKAQFQLEAAGQAFKKQFDGMKEAEQVAFIDRYKTGQAQPTPELQAAADLYSAIDAQLYNDISHYNPSLAWKEDHFRVMWKELPQSATTPLLPGMATPKKSFLGGSRRPLQGTKGFFNQATLADMSEGIQRGGVPVTFNPQTMFEMTFADGMKYVTAQKMWGGLKSLGLAKYVAKGGNIPPDFVRLDDKLAKVYFKAPQGMVDTGEWYVDEGAGRVLNNFLSRDLIRESSAGRGLLWIKNHYTAAELGLSAFHAVFESGEAIGSSVGLGMRKLWNLKDFAGGVKEIASAPIAPYKTAKLGGSAIKYLSNVDALVKQTGYDVILKQYPDAANLLGDLFTGGGKLTLSEDYKTGSAAGFRQAIANGNYPGAIIRALPALNETIQKPLFETYIPRLKVGTFLKEYSTALLENHDELMSGDTTRAELARKTWDFVEDRFGEMNFDNLFWDRTFKTANQIVFRSVTWKLGNLRATGGALPEQGIEAFSSVRKGQVPQLTPKMAWLFGMSALTVALGTAIQYGATGTLPQNVKDFVFPRINKDDNKERVSTPTYWKDAAHLFHSPTSYVTSSLTGEIGKLADIWQNKDFYGDEIYQPGSGALGESADMAKHLLPTPFSVSTYLKSREKGEPVSKSLMGLAGVSRAPGYVTQTPAEQLLTELYARHAPAGGRTPEESAARNAKKGIREAVKSKGDVAGAVRDSVKSGTLGSKQAMAAVKSARQPAGAALLKELTADESVQVYAAANETERKDWKAEVYKKVMGEIKARGGWRNPIVPKARAAGLLKSANQSR